MVLKSKRWQGLLNEVEGQGPFLVQKDVCAPRPLKITYGQPDGDAVEELVYEDCTGDAPKKEEDDELPARLLVPLSHVLRLKELCEHEHARYDKCVDTLTVCRSDYLKELCWLREQVHLLRNHPPTRNLPDENFEVRWFSPPKYLEPEMQKFLIECITDRTAHLTSEIAVLQAQVGDLEGLLGDPSPKVLLRRMLQDHKPSFILSELSTILRTREDKQDLAMAAKEIVQFLATEAQLEAPQVRTKPQAQAIVQKEFVQDPALLEEVEAYKKKALKDEQLIKQLRESLNEGLERRMDEDIDVEKRAEAEKSRADAEEGRANEERRLKEEARALASKEQRRAEELEAKLQSLQKELSKAPASTQVQIPAGIAWQVKQAVDRLGTANVSLSQGVASSASSGNSSGTTHQGVPTEGVDGAPDLDKDVNGLTRLASIMEETVRKALAELKAQPKEQKIEMARVEPDPAMLSQHKKDIEEAAKAAAEKATADLQREFQSRLRDFERQKADELADMEKNMQVIRARLQDEHAKNAELQANIEDLETKNVQLGQRMQKYKKKADEAKRKLKALRQSTDQDSSDSDDAEEEDDDDDDMRFLISYTRRTRRLSAMGKRRWEMLSEDADCAKQKREFIMGVHPLNKKDDAYDDHQLLGRPSQEDMPDVLQLLVREQHEKSHRASTMLAPRNHQPQLASTMPVLQKVLADRQQSQPQNLTKTATQQHEQVSAAFNFLSASRSAASYFPQGSNSHLPVAGGVQWHSSIARLSDLTDMPALAAMQRRHGQELTDIMAFGALDRQTQLVPVHLAEDMWPRNHMALAIASTSQLHTSRQSEPVEIKLLGQAVDTHATLPTSSSLQKTTAAVDRSDVEPHPLVHHSDSKGSKVSRHEAGPLPPRLVEKLWSSGTPQVKEWPQGASNSSTTQPSKAAHEEKSIVAQTHVEGSLESSGTLDPITKATESCHRSAFTTKRQGQSQSRKIFQTTWHGALQKGTSSFGNPAHQPGKPKSPRVEYGDSLPDLLSVDRQSVPPLKGRTLVTKASEERGRSENKMGKTTHGSFWPLSDKRSAKWPTRTPLTNAARANQHYASAPDLRFRATSECFLPEVLPPLPAGRQLKMERHYLPGLPS